MAEFGFGSGVLWGTRTDLASPAVSTPRRFGVLQDVNVSFTGEIKELFGQFQFPVDVARGKVKVECMAKFAQLQGNVVNDLFFGNIATAGQVLTSVGEIHTLTTADTIIVANASSFAEDLGVRYDATGFALTEVGTLTAAGQYTVNPTGTYTFNAADTAGEVIDVDYAYNAAAGGVLIPLTNNFMGYAPRFKAVLSQIYEGKTWTLTLNQCVATKFSLPTKLDDYVIEEFNFSAFADASNRVGQLAIGDLG